MLRNIPYITLWVRNFEETLTFYRDLLSLPVEYQNESFVQFATTGTKLYLHALREGPPLERPTVEVHFDVPDVDAAYERLRARGVSFERPPRNMPWGSRQVWMRDPEGYHVELVGPPTPGEPAVPESV